MPNFEERTIGPHTIRIDRDLCVGFGDCIDLAGEVFELDEEGVAVFRATAGELEPARLLEACDACPVDALSVHDARGTRLVP